MLKGEVGWFWTVLLSNYHDGVSKRIESEVSLKYHPLMALAGKVGHLSWTLFLLPGPDPINPAD